MSDFYDLDFSLVGSNPIECYHFYSSDEDYKYTNNPTPVTLAGIGTFIPASLSRQSYNQGSTALDFDLSVEFDSETQFIKDNRVRFGKPSLNIDAYRYQPNVTVGSKFILFFLGNVSSIDFADENATVKCVFFSSKFNNKILSYTTQKYCTHTLYGFFCGIIKSYYTYSGTISDFYDGGKNCIISSVFSGRSVTYGNLYNAITKENRTIQDAVYDNFGIKVVNSAKIGRPFTNGNIGDSIIFTLGCSKSYRECISKFNNLKHFGGFNDIPVDNPYSNNKILRCL